MPQMRRNSTGQVEGDHLEGITERTEYEEEQQTDRWTCAAPKDFQCLRGARAEHIFDLSTSVRLECSNGRCNQSKFMHLECFELWQDNILAFVSKLKDGGKRGKQQWTEKQKASLWRQPNYHLAVEVCGCCCGEGHLRKDLNWVPPMNATQGQSRERRREASGSEGEKQKKRRQKKSGKNSKPALTIGLPTFGVNGSQMNVKRSDAQGIPPAGGRQRTNSVSSTNSGSSSWGSSSPSSVSPPGAELNIPPRRSNIMERSRHDSGGSIFTRRSDYSSFNVLPRSKINSYHIKMEDECSIGNDETRCFILSSYATNKMNRVPCVLCNCMMNIFERYPLIDGTFFLSPRQHTTSCIPVKSEGRKCYLSAVCMGCLEGWTSRLQCRNQQCLKLWDGSQLILGTMYSYDIFAAVPCCADRLKCTSCSHLVIHPDQRFNFFSDYSQTVSCPQCGVQDFHFSKPLEKMFLSKAELEELSRHTGGGGASASARRDGSAREPLGLSWARVTAPCSS